jgi:hypothetical protein
MDLFNEYLSSSWYSSAINGGSVWCCLAPSIVLSIRRNTQPYTQSTEHPGSRHQTKPTHTPILN